MFGKFVRLKIPTVHRPDKLGTTFQRNIDRPSGDGGVRRRISMILD